MSYNTQVQRVMDNYGLHWFKFDETTGNATDSKGAVVGTVYSGVGRVTGWNGQDGAFKFNRNSTSYVRMNARVIPTGSYTLRFKMRLFTKPTAENQEIISNAYARTSDAGLRIWVDTGGNIGFVATRKGSAYDFSLYITAKFDSQWHDYMFVWDAPNRRVYVYEDEVLVNSGASATSNTLTPTFNLTIGRQPDTDYARYFNGELDEIQVYNRALTPRDFWINSSLIYHDGQYKTYDTAWRVVSDTLPSLSLFQSDGIEYVTPLFDRVNGYSPLDELDGDIDIVTWTDDDGASRALSLEVIQHPQLVYDKLDISLFGVEFIENINMVASGDSKVAISFDGGATWKAYKNGVWETVSDAHSGMTADELNALTSIELEEVREDSNFIRFNYSLTNDASIDDVKMYVTLVGKEKIASTVDYDFAYDEENNEIVYNFKKSGIYTINYVDAI